MGIVSLHVVCYFSSLIVLLGARTNKELLPRYSRSCNVLAWNPVYPNILACGLDKVRGDQSAFIWDINHTGEMLMRRQRERE